MTQGSPARLILRLAVPLILANLGQQLYGIVDAVIVGRGVGVSAFAALGACDWLIWCVLWSVQGLTQGFSTRISRQFGAKDMKGFRRTIAMCVWLCLLIGGGLTLVSVLFSGPLLGLLRTPETIFNGAKLYLRMIYGGTLIVMGYNMAAAMLRAVGDGKTPLIAMFVAGGSNIILDLLFVMVFRLGIAGAAAATLLAQLIALIYCLIVIRKGVQFQLTREDWRWHTPAAADLCRLGIPLVFASLIVAIGGVLAQYVINSYDYIFVAGCTAANKLHGTLDCSAVAIGFASATYMGQNYGAGRFDRIHQGIRSATLIALVIGGAISIIMIIFGRPVVSMFLAKDVSNAAEALDVAFRYVRVMSAMLICAYMMNLYRYSLQGLGNTVDPMYSGIFELAARVGVAYLLPLAIGSAGIFFMDGTAWFAAGVYQFICFFRTLHRLETPGRKSAQADS
ncbi:MAG: MATE family efflux transporter [Lachnospiraceae bacterium]|nr:MATE family efflux transporter [Lachnospiraceae bacterium]